MSSHTNSSIRSTITQSTRSSLESLDSSISRHNSIQGPSQVDRSSLGLSSLSLSSRILTRTSTIVNAIRDDNQYASKVESNKILPSTFGAMNPEEDTKSIAALANYDGEFNKQDVIDRPPDGTLWGWISAFCVCGLNTFSWGVNSVFGVFLNYYVSSNHFPGATMEDYALIGGLNLGLSFMLCNVANTLVRRFYYKYVMAVGIVMLVICYLCAAEATTIVQLIMLQGLLLSIAYALAAGPGFVIIPTWFLKKRSIATGIATAGAGLSGIIFSRPIQALIDTTGSYKWALRLIGIVCGVMLTVCTLLIRCRRKLKVVTGRSFWGDVLASFTRWDVYRQKSLIYLISWNFIYGFPYTILLFSMSSYSTAIGLTSAQGAIVTTVQSVAQCIGRPLLGLLSDYLGKTNITIIITALIGIFSLCWWTFVKTYANLIVFAFVTGIMVGVNWVNFSPLCADIVGGGDDLLAAVSFLCLVGGPSMIVSEIIGLKLERPDDNRPYLNSQILVGVMSIASAAVLIPFREFKIYRMLHARRELIQKKLKENRTSEDCARLKRYDLLLEKSTRGYILRSFYPIKA
ncbi:hypothetical protein FOA43_004147 [Brettanomyces nanus]|uniref:Major facilitator superfamily (MFS) profile domain-containing protein n=1 Tax=Eeniella nana TaxID=13502 RepID=A0A875S764_EENNA|nr:uncharacterized protein FOA43_004147 [Brettanomyces nanus]QPG76753.1 hypothetical protein FOA43_004147 [Brettanomyces nanus]